MLRHPDRTAVTVSGLSSGGFFAHQFHVAFSKLVKGAGIIAGGPYGCVENIPNPWSPFWPMPLDRVSAAVVACTHYYGNRYYGLRPTAPKAEDSIRLAREAASRGLIDDTSNLADGRVWLFHGKTDDIVPMKVSGSASRSFNSTAIPVDVRPITVSQSAPSQARASSPYGSADNTSRPM
jgi:predicted peptidase